MALDRVISLDPSFPGVAELKADILELEKQDDDLMGIEATGDGRALSASEITVDDWEDLEPVVETEGESSGSRWGFILLVVILLIVATGAALVASGTVNLTELLSGFLPTTEPVVIVVSEPTEGSALAEVELEASVTAVEEEATLAGTAMSTDEADAEPTAEATALAAAEAETDEPTPAATYEDASVATVAATETVAADPSPTADEPDPLLAAFVRDVAESISAFEIIQQSSGIENTALGDTLVLQLCAVPGREFNERLNGVMNAVVELAADIPEGIDAVAAGLLNCPDPNSSLRVIGVAVAAIQNYASEEINTKDFQRAWQPLS
ncbi:MAG: hypothetical protein OXG78_15465 [Chloroflexi bacterium]|nr:hypothetical protein [Chloroflexota bacterium]